MPEFNFFKASDYEQPPEVAEFIKDKLADPFNKYCIDCKKNLTSHCLLYTGIFICPGCAAKHREIAGPENHITYIKDLYKDHWDDYQLKSIQIGGNKPFF